MNSKEREAIKNCNTALGVIKKKIEKRKKKIEKCEAEINVVRIYVKDVVAISKAIVELNSKITWHESKISSLKKQKDKIDTLAEQIVDHAIARKDTNYLITESEGFFYLINPNHQINVIKVTKYY